MSDFEYLKQSAEQLLAFDPKKCGSRDEHQKLATLYAMAFREQATPEVVLRLLAECDRLKKFEDALTKLDAATAVIDRSFREERDVALFAVYWAARLHMVPDEIVEQGDEDYQEKVIRSGAEVLMVGGRRLYDAAERDYAGRPIIPFDHEYRGKRAGQPAGEGV